MSTGNQSKIVLASLESNSRRCKICKKTFSAHGVLVKHLKKTHNENILDTTKKFTCDICNKKYKSQVTLKAHVKIIHKTAESKKSENIAAKSKLRSFSHCYTDASPTVTNLNQPLFQLEAKNEIKFENIDIKQDLNNCGGSKDIYSDKSNESDDGNNCKICDKSFATRASFMLHIKRQHKQQRNGYTCSVCGETFRGNIGLAKHCQEVHPDRLSDNITTKSKLKMENVKLVNRSEIKQDDGKVVYQCQVCKKVFDNKRCLIYHNAIHIGNKKYFCHICGKRFQHSGGLSIHITYYHQKVRRFPCDICGKKFSHKNFLREHMNIHTGNRPYVCEICGESFKQHGSLHTHKISHSNDFKFTCTYCNKKFRRATDLKVHERTHTGERPYPCLICGARFPTAYRLSEHKKTHKDTNQWSCEDCGATFSKLRYLAPHKYNCLKRVNNDTISTKSS